mgnify:CR=1 FL=1
MDISSIYGSSALDSTAYTNAANQTASKLQNQLNGSDYTKATDDELMDAWKKSHRSQGWSSSVRGLFPGADVQGNDEDHP